MSALHEQIEATWHDFVTAWNAGDPAALGAAFTEDGALVNPFGQRADGRAAVTAMYTTFFDGMLGGTSTAVDVTHVRAVADDHALADAEQTIRDPDGNVVLEVHVTTLFRREDGRWLHADARPYVYAPVPAAAA